MRLPFPNAAIDLSSGNAAGSFLAGRHDEPWGRECFQNIIDTVLNHQLTYFPTLTRKADPETRNPFSGFFGCLLDNDLIKPYEKGTAEDVEWILNDLGSLAYSKFSEGVAKHTAHVAKWCAYHVAQRQIMQHYQTHSDVGSIIKSTWEKEKGNLLAKKHQMDNDHLKIGFELYSRALCYDNVLQGAATYFPHPFRRSLLLAQPIRESYADIWSWGSVVGRLIESGVWKRDPQVLAQNLLRLRMILLQKEATCFHLLGMDAKKQVDVLKQIAGELDIPATIGTDVTKLLGASSPVGKILQSVLQLIEESLPIQIRFVEVGVLGKYTAIRGSLDWGQKRIRPKPALPFS